LKKQPLKHNVIDRDKVFVPPNWDSWGKIRVLREGFDVEGVNEGWSIDIRSPLPTGPSMSLESNGMGGSNNSSNSKDGSGALAIFEDTIRDIRSENMLSTGGLLNRQTGQSIEVESLDTQDFLAAQVELLERLSVDEEHGQGSKDRRRDPQSRSMGYRGDGDGRTRDGGVQIEEGGRVNEHIGPVQFNMGGIQVDADDMLKRLKVRQNVLKKQTFLTRFNHYRFEKRTDRRNEKRPPRVQLIVSLRTKCLRLSSLV
jgi:dynein light intermediate chain 1, cytosolic